MNDSLDAYYERELDRIYAEAEDFGRRRGKIAARLRLGERGSQDPHVERLLQGFAYVAAGIRQRLDEDFPLLAETLLSSLHPHLVRPRPAMTVVRLIGSEAVAGVPGGYVVPPDTELVAMAADGSERRFRTRYQVNLLPVQVAGAEVLPIPPGSTAPADAVTMLTLRLKVDAPGQTFGSLAAGTLRLHLAAPRHQWRELYGFLFAPSGVEVSYADAGETPPAGGPARLTPVGLDGPAILPYAAPTPEGYQLLADYFAFPERFQFFDIENIPPGGGAKEMTIRVYGGRLPPGMTVEADYFRLGCTPAVNLFELDLHLPLSQEQPEYRLAVPDAAGPGGRVFSVDRVTAMPPHGGQVAVEPFFPFRAVGEDEDIDMCHLVRRRGEEVYLAFADMRGNGARWEMAQLSVGVTCFHGAGAAPLPPRPQFTAPERRSAVDGVEVVTAPTRPLYPPSGGEMQWRLMSHLVLNHLSLSGGKEGAVALREILRLYDWSDDKENRSRIGAVGAVESRTRIFRPGAASPDLLGCFLGGLDVDLRLGDEIAGDALFAAVLESFIAGYAALNTPLQITVRSELPGGKTWVFPTRMGSRRLI